MSAIEWRHNGRQLVIAAIILPPVPVTDLAGVPVRALVDTGSTTSGVTTAVAEKLGLVGRGKRPLLSARNEDQVERYLFRIGLHADPRDQDAPAFPHIFDDVIGFELRNSFSFEALIGMDILGKCDLILNRSSTCRLSFG